MRTNFFILLFLFSVSGYSMPKLGDYVKFEAGQVKGSAKTFWTFEKELIEQDGEFFTLKETTTPQNGDAIVNTSKVHISSLMDDQKIDYILSNCENFGGNKMKAHFPIGTQDVCRISSITSEKAIFIYYLKVPFGHAGNVIQTKDTFTFLSLKDFRFGK